MNCKSICILLALSFSNTMAQSQNAGCGLAVMDKCYSTLPPDGSQSSNLIEEIGAVDDAQTCQHFCNDLYPESCEWFMYDRTTNDCKLFKGSVSDLQDDCREYGYAVTPSTDQCIAAFDVGSDDECYNFREDYCRFEFTLLDNLESIQTLEDCQTACSYLTNCTFFFYDKDAKICKVNTSSIENRVCDMVHGTKEPALKDCLDAGKVQWSNPANSTK